MSYRSTASRYLTIPELANFADFISAPSISFVETFNSCKCNAFGFVSTMAFCWLLSGLLCSLRAGNSGVVLPQKSGLICCFIVPVAADFIDLVNVGVSGVIS